MPWARCGSARRGGGEGLAPGASLHVSPSPALLKPSHLLPWPTILPIPFPSPPLRTFFTPRCSRVSRMMTAFCSSHDRSSDSGSPFTSVPNTCGEGSTAGREPSDREGRNKHDAPQSNLWCHMQATGRTSRSSRDSTPPCPSSHLGQLGGHHDGGVGVVALPHVHLCKKEQEDGILMLAAVSSAPPLPSSQVGK